LTLSLLLCLSLSPTLIPTSKAIVDLVFCSIVNGNLTQTAGSIQSAEKWAQHSQLSSGHGPVFCYSRCLQSEGHVPQSKQATQGCWAVHSFLTGALCT
jgi:hypothetical protein